MQNTEKPRGRTRRSFIKRSAAAGIGAKSALIYGGLVMTSHSSTSTYTDDVCIFSHVSDLGPFGEGGAVIGVQRCKWEFGEGTTYCSLTGECGVTPDGAMVNGQRKKVIIKCDGVEVYCESGSAGLLIH